jgi:hypothetical protein
MLRVNAAIRATELLNSLDTTRFAQRTGNIRSLMPLRRVGFLKRLNP